MLPTKRKLRPDGFQTVGPPGSLAMPVYSCFSHSCALTDCEMYNWGVHGLGQDTFQNQDYEETLKRFSCRLKLTPLSRFHASGVSLFSLCNYKTQFFFISTLQRRNTVASWDVYSWGKRKTLYSFGKWTYLDPVSVFRSKERRLGQRGKNIVIVPGAARNDPARETWNFTEIQPRNILIDVWT